MLRNFRKPTRKDKQRYLRYDDVFLGNNKRPSEDSRYINEPSRNSNRNYVENNDDEDYYIENDDLDEKRDTIYNSPSNQDPKYFSGENSIIDERMVKYQKRQLPPLQRYSPNSYRDSYSEFNQAYWDEDYSPRKNSNISSLKQLWQKFIITFASIISLVCVAWIAYNWNNNNNHIQNNVTQDGIPLIEPEQQEFRVLPDDPGGAEISYKDKTVYEKVNNRPISTQEKLLPPQDDISYIPQQSQVEEYSIVDDKTYYIKISAGKTKSILRSELNLLKKRYPDFIDDRNCTIKRVSNSQGEKKYAILIGPFDSQDLAIDTAKSIGGQCYVISVKD